MQERDCTVYGVSGGRRGGFKGIILDSPDKALALALLTAAVEDYFSVPPVYTGQATYRQMYRVWLDEYESAKKLLFDEAWEESLNLLCELADWDIDYLQESVAKQEKIREPEARALIRGAAHIHYTRLEKEYVVYLHKVRATRTKKRDELREEGITFKRNRPKGYTRGAYKKKTKTEKGGKKL